MAQKESNSAHFNLAAHHDHDLASIHEQQIDYSGMPVSQTADDFVRGIDLILEAQQQFLSAMAPPESAKSKTFGAARK